MMYEFLQQLGKLPYADMMKLSAEIHRRMPSNPTATHMAQALSDIAASNLQGSEVAKVEHKVMQQLFRRRLSISVKELNGGFQIELQSQGVSVLHKDLKVGLDQLIDTLVAARMLRGSD